MTYRACPRYVGPIPEEVPAGHRFHLYWGGWNANWEKVPDATQQELSKISSRNAASAGLAQSLADRQRDAASKLGECALLRAYGLTSPLVIGIGTEHPTEIGFSFYEPHGVPYIPGSAVKGVVRRAAEELALFEDGSDWTVVDVWWLMGFDATSAYVGGRPGGNSPAERLAASERETWGEAFRSHLARLPDEDLEAVDRIVPPTSGQQLPIRERLAKLPSAEPKEVRQFLHIRGALQFWDVFFYGVDHLSVEVMTPHFPKYHARAEKPPTDDQEPVPLSFLSVPAGARVRVVVSFDPPAAVPETLRERWKELLKEAMDWALENRGLGAKTSAGYGRGRFDDEETQRIEGHAHAQRKRAEELARKREREERKRREREERLREVTAKGFAEDLAQRIVDALGADNTQGLDTLYKDDLDQLEGDARVALAELLMEGYKKHGKWSGKLSRKQKEKKQHILEIIEARNG